MGHRPCFRRYRRCLLDSVDPRDYLGRRAHSGRAIRLHGTRRRIHRHHFQESPSRAGLLAAYRRPLEAARPHHQIQLTHNLSIHWSPYRYRRYLSAISEGTLFFGCPVYNFRAIMPISNST